MPKLAYLIGLGENVVFTSEGEGVRIRCYWGGDPDEPSLDMTCETVEEAVNNAYASARRYFDE